MKLTPDSRFTAQEIEYSTAFAALSTPEQDAIKKVIENPANADDGFDIYALKERVRMDGGDIDPLFRELNGRMVQRRETVKKYSGAQLQELANIKDADFLALSPLERREVAETLAEALKPKLPPKVPPRVENFYGMLWRIAAANPSETDRVISLVMKFPPREVVLTLSAALRPPPFVVSASPEVVAVLKHASPGPASNLLYFLAQGAANPAQAARLALLLPSRDDLSKFLRTFSCAQEYDATVLRLAAFKAGILKEVAEQTNRSPSETSPAAADGGVPNNR